MAAADTFAAMFRWTHPAVRALLVCTSLAVSACAAEAQRCYLKLSGVVTDHFTGEPVRGVLVRVLKAGRTEAEVTTRGDGRYAFELDRGWRYAVWYSKDELVSKCISIDTEAVPPYPDVPFFEMDVQMTLFPWIADVDLGLFERPLGEAAYKASVHNMSWDTEYTERLRPVLSQVMSEYEKTYGGYYRRGGRKRKDVMR